MSWNVTNGENVLGTFRLKSEAQSFLWKARVIRRGTKCSAGAVTKHLARSRSDWAQLPREAIRDIIATCEEEVDAYLEGYKVKRNLS